MPEFKAPVSLERCYAPCVAAAKSIKVFEVPAPFASPRAFKAWPVLSTYDMWPCANELPKLGAH